MDKYIVTKNEIEEMQGLPKTHFLNDNAKRINKSLGDLCGLTGLGFHIIEVEPGRETTECHVHYYEDECVYVLEGSAQATIGEESFDIAAGDFIGYRAGGLSHTIINNGNDVLKCIVVGQRLDHDVADYTRLKKRIYRNKDLGWDVSDHVNIDHPQAGQKK